MVVESVWASDTAVFKLFGLLIWVGAEFVSFDRAGLDYALDVSFDPFV